MGAKNVAALAFGGNAIASELAYLTARYAALAPFDKIAASLSELLPLGRAQHASTVRNRTLQGGAQVVQAHAAELQNQARGVGPDRGRAERHSNLCPVSALDP